MKRTLSLVLVALLTLSLFCFTSCGAVNENEVSILWSGNGRVENPNSLINAMERAMYIKNIEYKHYGANGSLDTQVEQAKAALNAGCQVLVVELVSDNLLEVGAAQIAAGIIINAAKEKNVPVVFFNCSLLESIVESYDKCFLIRADEDSVADVQGIMMADYVKANFAKLDKNKDGKLSYIFYGVGITSASAVKKANTLLATEDYKVKPKKGDKLNTSIELATVELLNAELIVTESDLLAAGVLKELQEKDYNTDKLTTQFIPVFTVGEAVDYKDLVVAGRPEIPEELVIGKDDSDKEIKRKDKEIKKLEDLMNYYEEHKYLVDLTVVSESDLDEMVYTTINVIDAGRIAGTATEDRDAIANAVASVVRNLAKGEAPLSGVASEVKEGETPAVVVEGNIVKVRFIAYS